MKIKKYILYLFFTIVCIGLLAHGLFTLYDYISPYPNDLLNTKIQVIGTISSLPKEKNDSVSIELQTKNGLLDLYWSKRLSPAPKFKPGQIWSFTVKLKQPRGLLNPGVFDYGKWLKRHGVKAKGYIVVNRQYHLIKNNTKKYLVNQIRYSISQYLDKQVPDQNVLAFIKSILLGDKSSMSTSQKKLFQDTGTSHLIAISGLHIGLIFFWFFVLIRLVWSCSVKLCAYISAQTVGMWSGLLIAFSYSLLSGFAISTQRALIMLAIFVIARTFKYNISPRRILTVSALFIILWWPFSIFDIGFWLSFSAVAFLIYALSARVAKNSFFSRWLYPQFLVLIALMPMTIFWFGAVSTSAFIANIIAIPVVSFIIVPGLFIALCLALIQINLFMFITPIIKLLFIFLTMLQTTFHTVAISHGFGLVSLVLAMIGMLLLFSPRGFRLKVVGFILMFPAIFYNPQVPDQIDFRVYVLDVGQGLAVVIQAGKYVMVYDTGPKYFSGSNAGSMVIIPFLKHIGIKKINTLVISHADLDHRGGFNSLYQAFPVEQVITSFNEITHHIDQRESAFSLCQEGDKYSVGKIKFEFLNPTKFRLANKESRNNLSCVLKVSNARYSMLLTGDIEKVGENYLIDYHSGQLPSDILIAPHHGSLSSSSKKFIKLINPDYVIYATGYKNRFGFPKLEILKRFEKIKSSQYSTAACGAIEINVSKKITIDTVVDNCKLKVK